MDILGHFKTITSHKLCVMAHCFKMGIYKQGLTHDLSKYSPTEFIPGCKYYQGFQSPNNAEREDIGYSSAWLHHKGRNKHHFEYWQDLSLEKRGEMRPIKMPRKYVAEMAADRIAASKIYQGKDYTDSSAYEYFERGKIYSHNMLHPDTEKELGHILKMLSVKGEEYTFNWVRTKYLHKHSLKHYFI